jgi:hypothetical protein
MNFLYLDPASGELNQCGIRCYFDVGRHQSGQKLIARERIQIIFIIRLCLCLSFPRLGPIFSVNTWVESPLDDEVRVEEGLVRLQAAMLAKTIPN